GLTGGALSLLMPMVSLGIPSWYVFRKSNFRRIIQLKVFPEYSKYLFKYSLMVFASATTLPIGEMFVRSLLIDQVGIFEAGLWQSLLRLSVAYTSFFALFLAYYYMPQLSSLVSTALIIPKVNRYFVLMFISFAGFAVFVWLIRGWVIPLVLS